MLQGLVDGIRQIVESIGMIVFAVMAMGMAAKERYTVAIPLGIAALLFALFLFGGDGLLQGLACQVNTWANVPCR